MKKKKKFKWKKVSKIRKESLLSKGTCRDCGEVTTVNNNHWYRAAKPRCMKCGGLLERPHKTNLVVGSRARMKRN